MPSEPASSPSVDHLDWDKALRGVNGDPKLLREIFQIFLDESPKWLGQERQALAAKDAEASRRVAHMIKGAVSQLGMEIARDLAQRMEDSGRAGQFEQAEALFNEFEQECAMLQPHLLRFVESTPIS